MYTFELMYMHTHNSLVYECTIFTQAQTCIDEHMVLCACTHYYAHTYTCTHINSLSYTYECNYTCICIHTCMPMHVYAYMYASIQGRECIHVYAHTNTYAHILYMHDCK